VDTLQLIIQRYIQHNGTKELASLWQSEPPARIELRGLIGAQECFVLAGAYLNAPRFILLVATDKEEAAYFQNTLTSLLTLKEIHFFPDSFRQPANFESLNANNVLQRTETINKLISSDGKEVMVTYPEALFEKVVAPAALNKTRIDITVNEKLDLDFLIEILVEYGFNRVDFVFEPGQFSIRGGIVDVYSYGNEYPYRVELFDDAVESIRTFDPLTQLSYQKIARVSIVPNINTKFEQQDKVSLFDVLPPNTVVWIRDFQIMLDKLQHCFEKAEVFAKSVSVMDDDQLKEIFRDRAFIRPFDIAEDVQSHPLVLPQQSTHPFELTKTIQFHGKPQPSFNRNFSLLITNLHENTNNRLENFIFTDNPKQVERFHSIFRDLEAKVKVELLLCDIFEGFIDEDLHIACYTDHQVFERYHRYRLRTGFSKEQALNLRLLRDLQPGDFVTHIDHGIGKFSGLEKISVGGQLQEAVRLIYKNNDLLYVSINSLHKIAKFVGKEGTPPALSNLGSEAWANLKKSTKKKIKEIAFDLIQLYAKRKASKGIQFPPDNYLQNELEASFIYEDTPDQVKSTQDVKTDMEKPYPMDRLICGDVGFGKTEVAIRAAFKAVISGKQVAILVPTTILALQHQNTFSDRLAPFGVTVDFINRFRTTKEKKQVLENLKVGKVDVIIGTHSLVGKDIAFKDLGLLIIDEEQKFGVAAKEKLRNIKVNVDTLTLTATPIPRTLQFSLMAARDLSVIRTPPPNRQPIHTEIRTFSDDLIRDAIFKEVYRGGQVFFVHNRVSSLPEMLIMLKELCPEVSVAMAHGQMKPEELEQTLIDFIDHRFDVLVSTNIIETGLDIPNANTIIINNAHQFGMSDLHQLRGRVGRSNRKAYCYLFCPPMSVLSQDARKRLRTIEEFSDLGSGFNIAMRDLDIRGAGDLLEASKAALLPISGTKRIRKF
jgi:transcription-repair coupling factor (superfamily II helicase)